MKCVCGYEYVEEWRPENRRYETIKGDEQFMGITGNFFVQNDNPYNPGEHKVSFFACPKCRTIQMND